MSASDVPAARAAAWPRPAATAKSEMIQAYNEALKATDLQESNAAVQLFAAAQSGVNPSLSQPSHAQTAEHTQAEPAKAVKNEFKCERQDIIKGLKSALQVPVARSIPSVVNNPGDLVESGAAFGSGYVAMSRRLQQAGEA